MTFAPGTLWGFEQMLAMKAELGDLLGRPIDLVEKQLIDESLNYIRRKHILTHMDAIYVA